MNQLLFYGLIEVLVGVAALAGIFLGAISFLYPDHSIELYQFLMHVFNWDVHPIDYIEEIKRTKVFGGIMFLISVAILVILFRPQLVVHVS